MCGIAGYCGFDGGPGVMDAMLGTLGHRGPDDGGGVVHGDIALGMRRLSIIDLSTGHQPMFSPDGRLAIVFNGEIYNYRELRADLEQQGVGFSTQSDTEVLLQLYRLQGADCLRLLRGMFTFAVADRQERSVFVARDRLGQKPLYLWREGRRLVFASEIKALLEHPLVPREPDPAAVEDYLALRYVPGPGTLFRGIEKFPAAHWMLWRDGEVGINRYWDLPPYRPATESPAVLQERFDALFDESVRLRMIADVPLGAYLSGGVDSGAVVASMARQSPGAVKTFTVGFGWEGDELVQAKATARRLGCDHHEILCREEDFGLLPQIIWNLDEPVGDAIIVPMYLLSRLARREVAVVLAGEGADETLGGYFMHRALSLAGAYRRFVPRPLRGLAPRVVGALPPRLLNRFFDYPADLGNTGRQRLLDFLGLLERGSLDDQNRFILSLFNEAEQAELLRQDLNSRRAQVPEATGLPLLERILRLQYGHWLPDDILCKHDKLTMAHSIEGRLPFMDHKLVEFVSNLPPHLKLSPRGNKRILRRHMASRNPGLHAAPKVPFYIPIDKFLNTGPLAELTARYLNEDAVNARGLFRWEAIRRLSERVGGGEFLYGKQLFSILCLELWWRIFIDREPGLAPGTPPAEPLTRPWPTP